MMTALPSASIYSPRTPVIRSASIEVSGKSSATSVGRGSSTPSAFMVGHRESSI